MSLVIQATNLSYSFGASLLFNALSVSVHQGQIFALIGENGSGKTTLLKLLAGEIPLQEGQILRKTSHITFLPQEVAFEENISVRAFLKESPLKKLEEALTHCLESNQLEKWASLHEEYERLGGYWQIPIEKWIQDLGIEALLSEKMESLSQGQQHKVALCKVLSFEADLLLLDEPTNHLDEIQILWLQEILKKRKSATLIVSHDRAFLNQTCSHLLDLHQGKLSFYQGTYDFYLEEKKRLQERALKAYLDQETEREELKEKIKSISFASKKPAPAKDRNLMAYDHRGEKHQKSQKRHLEDLKSRLEAIEKNPLSHPKPKTIKGIHFEAPLLTSPIGLEEASKTLGGKKLFSHLSFSLKPRDRLLMIGPNGSGKTTLLKCIAKLLPLDSGRCYLPPSAQVGFLDQEVSLPLEISPLHYFEKQYGLNEEALRKELHKAGLHSFDLLKLPFKKLSLGQRKRMKILSLILEKPNLLILDEPTNHLDLVTLEALEEALLQFQGIVIAASHDKTFIKKIATDILKF